MDQYVGVYNYPSIHNQGLTPVVTTSLDRIVVLGKTWNIVKFDSVQHLQKNPVLSIRPGNACTGCESILGNYESVLDLPLVIDDGLKLSLLICTASRVDDIKRGLNAASLVDCCKIGIQRAIEALPSGANTRAAFRNCRGEELAIFNSDWEELGVQVGYQIKMAIQSGRNPRIHSPNIYFVATLCQKNLTLQTLNLQNVQNVRTESSDFVVVYCAYHYTVKNHILWWRTNVVQEVLQLVPETMFRVAALPGLGNCYFKLNEPTCKNVQFCTHIFDDVLQKELKLLYSTDFKSFLRRVYGAKITGMRELDRTLLEQDKEQLDETALQKLLTHCIDSIKWEVPAKLGITYTREFFCGDDVPSLADIIHIAFNETQRLVNTDKFGNPKHLLHAMETSFFADRNINILSPIHQTLKAGSEYLAQQKYSRSSGSSHSRYIFSKKEIHHIFVCYTIMRYYFKGCFMCNISNRVKELLKLREEDMAHAIQAPTLEWPFHFVRIVDNMIIAPEFCENETSNLLNLVHSLRLN